MSPPYVAAIIAAAGAGRRLTADVRPDEAVPPLPKALQSLGGEDFAWYLDHVPGSMARLGVKPPGQEHAHDLHQGSFDVDEDALPVAVRVLVATALAALSAA